MVYEVRDAENREKPRPGRGIAIERRAIVLLGVVFSHRVTEAQRRTQRGRWKGSSPCLSGSARNHFTERTRGDYRGMQGVSRRDYGAIC